MSDATTPATSFVPGTPPPSGNSIFGTKIPSVTSFAVGVLLFLLPFVDIKCGGMSLKKLTGAELATGYDVNMGNDNSIAGKLQNFDLGNKETKPVKGKNEMNYYMLAALVLGVVGLVLSILKFKAGATGAMVMAALSAIALIGFFIDVKRQLREVATPPSETDNLGMSRKMIDEAAITVQFTAGFYLSLLAFIAAAYFSYRRMKATK